MALRKDETIESVARRLAFAARARRAGGVLVAHVHDAARAYAATRPGGSLAREDPSRLPHHLYFPAQHHHAMRDMPREQAGIVLANDDRYCPHGDGNPFGRSK
jgi:hypothetical protein